MLAKANYPLSLHLRARSDQKNNKSGCLSREKMITRQQERKFRVWKSCASRRYLRPQNQKPSERERERDREKERERESM